MHSSARFPTSPFPGFRLIVVASGLLLSGAGFDSDHVEQGR